MDRKEVLCVGLACMDVLIKNTDLSTPFTRETKSAEQVSASVGGDAANESIILSRLGHSVQLMCGIARDGVGGFISSYMDSNQVDMTPSVVSEKGESAINVIVIQNNGERNFINSGVPEAACFTPDISRIEGVQIVSIASLFMPPFADPENVFQVAKKAKEEGAVTCLDVIVGEGACLEDYKAALSYIDYVFPNREEAELLTKETDLDEMADAFLRYGVKNAIIKIGKDGCFVKNQDESFIAPGYCVKNVVDTTGAGDNFAAGFISGLLQKMNLKDACRYACGVAGVAIQFQGGCTGVKSRQQVETMLAKME